MARARRRLALKCLAFAVRDNLRHYLTVTLHHSEHDSLVRRATATNAGAFSADVGLINFDLAIERKFIVHLCHVISDLMAHAPRCLIGHAKLPFQFLCRNAMPGSGEQINREEPRLQGSAAILKQCSDSRVKVMAADATTKGAFGLNPIPLGFALALRAFVTLTKAHVEKVFKTGLIIWELSKKFLQCDTGLGFFFARCSFHAPNIRPNHPLCQWDNSEYFIQKHSLTAAYIGFPIVVLMGHHAPRGLQIGIGGLLAVIFCWAGVASLLSGVAFGAGYIRYERKTKPKQFWLLIVTDIFVIGTAVYLMI